MARETAKTVRSEYVRGAAIAEMLDISLRTLYRKVSRGELPPPVHIGNGTSRWCLGEVEAYLARMRAR
jgi:predicted DNA-binding transcriptional regulator AlpA